MSSHCVKRDENKGCECRAVLHLSVPCVLVARQHGWVPPGWLQDCWHSSSPGVLLQASHLPKHGAFLLKPQSCDDNPGVTMLIFGFNHPTPHTGTGMCQTPERCLAPLRLCRAKPRPQSPAPFVLWG